MPTTQGGNLLKLSVRAKNFDVATQNNPVALKPTI